MRSIGKKIRLLRFLRGWSQEDVVAQLGISCSAYSKIENGITDPTYSRLNQLAAVFGMTTVDLLTYDDHKTSPEQEKLFLLKSRLSLREAELVRLRQKVAVLSLELAEAGPVSKLSL